MPLIKIARLRTITYVVYVTILASYLNKMKDQLHANLHQKFNHSGVDSERLVLLKKLLLDFVSSFVESHKYYNRNENLHPAYDFDQTGSNGHISHGHVSHSPTGSNYGNSTEHIRINTTHQNTNISSNANNMPNSMSSNTHDSTMNLSATINQMIDDTLSSSANHRQESNPTRIDHHSGCQQEQSFNTTSHHLPNENEIRERLRYQSEPNDKIHNSEHVREHHSVSRSPEPIRIPNRTLPEPSNISQSTRKSKQSDDDDYIPSPRKTPKKVNTIKIKKKIKISQRRVSSASPKKKIQNGFDGLISKETLDSIKNHMTNHISHDTSSRDTSSRDRLQSSDSQPPLPEDEISILDCEFEIIHSETDPDSSLVNQISQSEASEIRSQSDISESVPDLESVKSIPRGVSNSVLDELETKSTTSSINIPHNIEQGSPNRSARGRPPKRSTEFKFGSIYYIYNDTLG